MRGRRGLILSIVLGLLVLLVFWFVLVNPKRGELAEVKVQIEKENALTQQLTVELNRLQDLQANAAELQAELATIRGFVPLRPELANFIFQVQDASNSAGLDFVQITPELPKTPPEGAALAQVRATIVAKGGYFALQDFLRRLYNLDRALRVDTMAVTVDSLELYGTRLSMTIASRIFYELPATPAATATVPGATPSPTPTTTP